MTQFLYPTAREFPFDQVCDKIVRELELRNWDVPGITVEFYEYGGFRIVQRIRNENFMLYFCRIQGSIPGSRYNNIAGIMDIVIPKKQLRVYEKESAKLILVCR